MRHFFNFLFFFGDGFLATLLHLSVGVFLVVFGGQISLLGFPASLDDVGLLNVSSDKPLNISIYLSLDSPGICCIYQYPPPRGKRMFRLGFPILKIYIILVVTGILWVDLRYLHCILSTSKFTSRKKHSCKASGVSGQPAKARQTFGKLVGKLLAQLVTKSFFPVVP